ncbi:MAG: hypothetical protein WCP60_02340 [bacterium]
MSGLDTAGLGANGTKPELPGALGTDGGISGPGGLIGAGAEVKVPEEDGGVASGGAGGMVLEGAGGPPAGGIEVEEIPTAIGLGGSLSGGSFMGAPGAGGTGGRLGLSMEGSLTAFVVLKFWRD